MTLSRCKCQKALFAAIAQNFGREGLHIIAPRKRYYGGGVPFSHPSLGLSVFFLSLASKIRLSARRALTPRHGRMGGTPTREICSTPPLPRRRCLEMAPFSPPGHYQRADESRRVFFWGRRRFNVQQCARLALPTRALLHVFVPCTKVNDTKRLMTEHSC